jgi:antitoxin component HigA of HigAB toxin-antitoxin module
LKIKSNKEYKEALHKVYQLMNKGEKNITSAEAAQIEAMAKVVEYYEDHVLKIMPLPVTIASIVHDKIETMNITQAKLSKTLNIGTAKLSQILNGKRKPDVPFLKAIHEKLNIDGNLLLEKV